MKLSINTDFTKLPKVVAVAPFEQPPAGSSASAGIATLPHDERHLRRKVLELAGGNKVFVDLAEPVVLVDGMDFVSHPRPSPDAAAVAWLAPVARRIWAPAALALLLSVTTGLVAG